MRTLLAVPLIVALITSFAATSIAGEAEVLAALEAKGARIKRDESGHAVRVMVGKALTLEELQSVRHLSRLEQLAVNVPPAGDDEWGFLRELPKLDSLTIWHGHQFRSLKPFNGLKIRALTLGGCMGLRDLNRSEPIHTRDAVLTLRDLPNLERLTLYHSPLTPGDAQLAHIVEQFPKLKELRIDFAVPRGTESKLTAAGLERLGRLPLTKLGIEHAQGFSIAQVEALAAIKTLENLHVHPRGSTVEEYRKLLQPFTRRRPDVKLTFQPEPPRKK